MRYAPRTLILALILLFCWTLLQPGLVHAAAGLTVSPPLKDITLGSGLVETTSNVTLQNNTPQQVSVGLKLVDLKALGEYGGSSLDKAGLSGQYDLANWMSLPGGDTVVIASGQTVTIPVKIENRPDLVPGGHYGAVIITTTDNGSAKSNVNINQQAVSLLFVKKLGGERYGLNLKTLTTDQSKGRLPDVANLTFSNTGNVHVSPRGYVEVTDPSGKVLSKGIINPDSSLILPGGSRQMTVLLHPIANSRMSGTYKVTAYYRYDGQDSYATQTTTFKRGFSPVLALIFGGLLGLIGITVLIRLYRTRKR